MGFAFGSFVLVRGTVRYPGVESILPKYARPPMIFDYKEAATVCRTVRNPFGEAGRHIRSGNCAQTARHRGSRTRLCILFVSLVSMLGLTVQVDLIWLSFFLFATF